MKSLCTVGAQASVYEKVKYRNYYDLTNISLNFEMTIPTKQDRPSTNPVADIANSQPLPFHPHSSSPRIFPLAQRHTAQLAPATKDPVPRKTQHTHFCIFSLNPGDFRTAKPTPLFSELLLNIRKHHSLLFLVVCKHLFRKSRLSIHYLLIYGATASIHRLLRPFFVGRNHMDSSKDRTYAYVIRDCLCRCLSAQYLPMTDIMSWRSIMAGLSSIFGVPAGMGRSVCMIKVFPARRSNENGQKDSLVQRGYCLH
ncbi:hypothetical protein AVEN_65642-1 [Araneus ventricosus]|uniref:Uncharacterized protein n=1 Tax=Araneus ventricosus TaxID=182803 RepID=A0A4Y2J108_ARAVE|nr:hypothetical protein AVEN_65642-1 [Araneus ventricosus]